MPHKKNYAKPVPHRPASAFEEAWGRMRAPDGPPATVSARWLLTAVGLAMVAAAACSWGALCLLFWQGSWQLLYHPEAAVKRTPASVGLAFEPVAFAATEAGQARLAGWWMAAEPGARYERFTVLYLHGSDGNLGDTVEALAALHGIGLNVLAFDYRGYGQSLFERPSEARWKEDAGWALEYLTGTRHIAAGAIVLDGKGLGADLVAEIGAEHPELGGLVAEEPVEAPVEAIFRDPRARMVPARWLVRDRFDLGGAAGGLRIPSLWVFGAGSVGKSRMREDSEAYRAVAGPKVAVWLTGSPDGNRDFEDGLRRWLDDLPNRRRQD
jgi:pimeloyl-ACP methyl ester carboxylesterase